MAGEDPKGPLTGASDEFLSQPPGKRSLIVLAGPLGNYIFGFILFFLLFSFGFPSLGTKIGKVLEGYPAQKYGLKVGDRILAVDGNKVRSWEELTKQLHPRPNQEVVLKIKRADKVFDLKVKTTEKEFIDLIGRKRKVGLIGIMPDPEDVFILRHPLPKAFLAAMKKVTYITETIFVAIVNIIRGKLALRGSLSGPVGILYISKEAVKLGLPYFMSLMAVISISLAIFNLLPIPVLDGGHLLFAFIEKVRGKPLSPRTQESLTQLGMTLLLLLVIIVTYFDLLRIFKK
jgi:regulator of sigma E protease